MPYIKDPTTLLVECAGRDLVNDTETTLRESAILSTYQSIEECAEDPTYSAAIVPVMKIGNDYLTEMNYLYPYMHNCGISSISEALDDVAAANRLAPHTVGLLVESQEYVTGMINEALGKNKNKALNKVSKAEKLVDDLKKKGFPVKKKKKSPKKEAATPKQIADAKKNFDKKKKETIDKAAENRQKMKDASESPDKSSKEECGNKC